MSAPTAFHQLFRINVRSLTRQEVSFLEGELFIRICEALMEKLQLMNYYSSNFIDSNDKEEFMIDISLIRYMINDLLCSRDYTISGLAFYTNTPEEIVYDTAIGRNIYPSFLLGRKILELHRIMRPEFYRQIINKIKREITTEDSETIEFQELTDITEE